MARILDISTGRSIRLRSRHRIGRGGDAHLVLADRRVSTDHAVLRWTGTAWELRDLGSRNGTFADGSRLQTAGSVALRVGQKLAFGGDTPQVEVVDLNPPELLAVDAHDAAEVGMGGILALPSPDDPKVVILRDPDGVWLMEDDVGERAVSDGAVIELDGATWNLHLPEIAEGTLEYDSDEVRPSDLELEFRVSLDEEYVELDVVHGSRRWALGARAHHYTLLTLARQRLTDLEDASLPDTARGWISQERLQRQLGYSRSGMQVAIFRARQEFAQLGIVDAAGVVERRRGAGQLRLGVPKARVSTV